MLIGAMAGIAGSLAMGALQLVSDRLSGRRRTPAVTELSLRGGRQDIASLKRAAAKTSRPQRDATAQAARRIALAAGLQSTSEQEHRGGVAIHYLFGAMAG